MQKYKTKSLFARAKDSFLGQCSQAKGRLIVALLVAVICFVAGIVICVSLPEVYPRDEYLLSCSGVKSGFGAFFSRSFSAILVMGVCFVTTLSPWTMPIAVLVLGFRGYLLGYNICCLCAGFGMSGMLHAILIVVPCQLCMLIALTLFFAFISRASSCCKKFGKGSASRLKIFLCFLAVILIINLIETLLLLMFSAKVILVV